MTTQTEKGQQVPVKVSGASNFSRYNKISSEKTFNMFIVDSWLVNYAGYKRVLDIISPSLGEGRGIFRSIRGNLMVVVINAGLYRIDTNLAVTFIGNLTTNVGEVSIDENLSSQICIVDGFNAYIYNYTLPPNLTVQALDPGLVPNYVAYHNTFFLFGNSLGTGGARWYVYNRTADTTIGLVSVQTLQTKPDLPLAIVRIPNQSANVLVLGTSVCEIQRQVGGALNYQRNNTISIDYGCLSVNTIDDCDDYIAWLAVNEKNQPVIMVYSGQGAQAISTDGIDHVMDKIKFPSQSTAAFQKVDGHLIYQLTFYNTADNISLMYDFNTKMFFNLSDEKLNYHPARAYAYFNLKTYFVSLNNASLYEFSTDFTNVNENISTNDATLIHDIPRIRITDTIRQDDSSKFISNLFTFTVEQGNDPRVTDASLDVINGIITEDIFNPADTQIITEWGADIVDESSWIGQSAFVIPYRPRIDLSISQDGGITWSNEIGRELNPVGHRKNILQWNRLGGSNSMTLKIRFWGLDRFVAYQGILEVR